MCADRHDPRSTLWALPPARSTSCCAGLVSLRSGCGAPTSAALKTFVARSEKARSEKARSEKARSHGRPTTGQRLQLMDSGSGSSREWRLLRRPYPLRAHGNCLRRLTSPQMGLRRANAASPAQLHDGAFGSCRSAETGTKDELTVVSGAATACAGLADCRRCRVVSAGCAARSTGHLTSRAGRKQLIGEFIGMQHSGRRSCHS